MNTISSEICIKTRDRTRRTHSDSRLLVSTSRALRRLTRKTAAGSSANFHSLGTLLWQWWLFLLSQKSHLQNVLGQEVAIDIFQMCAPSSSCYIDYPRPPYYGHANLACTGHEHCISAPVQCPSFAQEATAKIWLPPMLLNELKFGSDRTSLLLFEKHPRQTHGNRQVFNRRSRFNRG